MGSRSLIGRLYAKTVFKKISHGSAMNDILAILFHRLAATTYGFYALWAVISIIAGVPSIVRAEGDVFQTIFSALVLVSAAPACIGATFWPVLARLELFSSSAFLGSVLLYLYFIFRNVFESDGSLAGFILIMSIVTLPACRIVVVTVLLLRQAAEQRAAALIKEAEDGLSS